MHDLLLLSANGNDVVGPSNRIPNGNDVVGHSNRVLVCLKR